jgi:glutathione S-transferase
MCAKSLLQNRAYATAETDGTSLSWHCPFIELQITLLLLLLLQGPYFLGSDISLVDITFAPMLERAAASLCYYKVTARTTSLHDRLLYGPAEPSTIQPYIHPCYACSTTMPYI